MLYVKLSMQTIGIALIIALDISFKFNSNISIDRKYKIALKK